MMPSILKATAAVVTVATGLLGAIRPSAVPDFTGLKPTGARGVTEIRSIFGGLFIALGAYPLVTGADTAYHMLGVMYLAIGAVRLISMLIDESLSEVSNLASLAVEIVLGVILVV